MVDTYIKNGWYFFSDWFPRNIFEYSLTKFPPPKKNEGWVSDLVWLTIFPKKITVWGGTARTDEDKDGRLVFLVEEDVDEVLVEYLLLLLSVSPLSDDVEDNSSWFFLRSLSAMLCAKKIREKKEDKNIRMFCCMNVCMCNQMILINVIMSVVFFYAYYLL